MMLTNFYEFLLSNDENAFLIFDQVGVSRVPRGNLPGGHWSISVNPSMGT
jgi:hypothetical protein